MAEDFKNIKEPEFHGDKQWYEKELRERLRHFYGQIDGSYSFPNSLEGDLLIMTWKLLLLSEKNDDHTSSEKREGNEENEVAAILVTNKQRRVYRNCR